MAFEKIKAFFRRGGVFTDSLTSPADHPKVGIDPKEYGRVLRNMRVYAGEYDPVLYTNAAGRRCTRPFVPLNIVKFSANWMATIIYNENARITIADPAAKEYITEMFEQNNFSQNFQQYLEVMFAVGGLVIRPYYAAGSRSIKLSWCLPDRFFPLESNTGEVSELAITTKAREVKGKQVFWYTLYEFHEWVDGNYTISYELYESDSQKIVGKWVPLATLPKFAELPERSTIPNLTRPQFVHLKPATMNNIDPDSPLGLGLVDNSWHTIETINVLHDKFRRNIDRSRSGIVIEPESMDVRMEDGQMYIVEDPDEIFMAIPGASAGLDKKPVTELTIPIQPDGHITAINFEIRTYEAQNGISPGTFTFDGSPTPKTATEVVSEDSMTYQTRNKQVMVIEAGIRDLVWSILELAKALELYNGPTRPPVTVDFDDGVFQDKDSQLEYYSKAVAQKMIPRLEAIKRAFNLTEEDAKLWKQIIDAEEQQKLVDASRLRSDLAFGSTGVDE